MIEGLSDTIVAVSSAPGTSVTGIVRLDGPKAIELAAEFIHLSDLSACGAQTGGRSIEEVPGATRVLAEVVLDEGLLAPATVYLFRSPRSYTRNDLVEIHAPGSPTLLRWIVDLAVRRGARHAAPGEFTARAYLNGAMSLADAEAVAEVIRAGTDQELAAAQYARSGRLAREAGRIAEELADLAALVEAQIDFAEEPIEFITVEALETQVVALDDALAALERPAALRERHAESPRVLLTGRPNAGKSTLFNALLGGGRAITSPVAGTTRDILTATIRLETGEAVLVDAAGIDEKDEGLSAAAREAALREAGRADLILHVIDASHFMTDEASVGDGAAASGKIRHPWPGSVHSKATSTPGMVVMTKWDLVPEGKRDLGLEWGSGLGLGPVTAVCAPDGRGLTTLRKRLAERLMELQRTAAGAATAVNVRQAEAVSAARAALTRARELIQASPRVSERPELLAFELREALDSLGALTGAVTTDDLLGRVFAGFCIGK